MTITYQGPGSGSNSQSGPNPAHPATVDAGDLQVLVVTSGGATDPTPDTPAGWDFQVTANGGSGTFGGDTGPRRSTLFTLEADGTEDSSTVSINITDGNTSRGQIHGFNRTEAAWSLAAVGTSFDTFGSTEPVWVFPTVDVAAGDVLLIALSYANNGSNPDAGTAALSGTGLTFGAITEQVDSTVNNGNDHRHVVFTSSVASGSGSVAITFSVTLSGSGAGAATLLRIRETAGGGGTDYDRTNAETLGLLDAAVRSAASTRSQAETLGFADQISHSLSAARATADNLGLVDSLARGVAAERSLLDTAGLLDQVTRTGAFVRSIGDALTLTDSLTFELTLGGGGGTAHVRSIADSLGLSDAVARSITAERALTDPLPLADSVTRSQDVGRALGSALGLSDALSGFRQLIVTLGDTLGLSDGLQRVVQARRSQADPLAFDDILARAATSARALNAALGLSDALAHFILGGLSAPVQDCVLSARLTDSIRLMASDTIDPLRKCS